AAPPRILLSGSKIRKLARDHNLDCHHRDLVRNAREVNKRFAKLPPGAGIAERLIHRCLRDPDCSRGGLYAGGFEGRHELLEAKPLDAPKEVLRLYLEAVERELVFLHSAITEH